MGMKAALWGLGMMLLMTGICLAQVPHQIGGFVLGDNIEKYTDRLRADTDIRIRHLECMKEVETHKIEGFKSGLIYYGTCTGQNRIIRIKLKYEDPSVRFYEDLLKRFKARFGEPNEWKGDPFHIVVAWKWYFTDKEKNRITLILQHNTQDEEQKMGNAVKLTMTNLMDAERSCFRKKEKKGGGKHKKRGNNGPQKPDWDRLIPR